MYCDRDREVFLIDSYEYARSCSLQNNARLIRRRLVAPITIEYAWKCSCRAPTQYQTQADDGEETIHGRDFGGISLENRVVLLSFLELIVK